jgi:peptidoglycan/xylan/chitin deacetylase (PgdA/CDA1 family)
VSTHDVESADGLAGIEPIRAVERRHGLVSSWNFVPERYALPASVRSVLVEEGCEIGVHGLRHDGRDLASDALFAARLPAMRAYAQQWGATGFRAPAMQRSWARMRTLGLDHDSSFPDTDPFQPSHGGCCSWWPLLIGPTVELPLTLPQDHTLFVILEGADPHLWLTKARLLRDRGGLAQVLVHPDYVRGTGSLVAYEELLESVTADTSAWLALPSQVSSWWRARHATGIVAGPHGWEASGPAASEAVVTPLPACEHSSDPHASHGNGNVCPTIETRS